MDSRGASSRSQGSRAGDPSRQYLLDNEKLIIRGDGTCMNPTIIFVYNNPRRDQSGSSQDVDLNSTLDVVRKAARTTDISTWYIRKDAHSTTSTTAIPHVGSQDLRITIYADRANTTNRGDKHARGPATAKVPDYWGHLYVVRTPAGRVRGRLEMEMRWRRPAIDLSATDRAKRERRADARPWDVKASF